MSGSDRPRLDARSVVRRRSGSTDPQAPQAAGGGEAVAEPEVAPAPEADQTPYAHLDAPAPSPFDGDALMAELDALSDADLGRLLGGPGLRQLEPGDEVEGEVVRVTADTILVDVGAKSEGVIERAKGDTVPEVGERIRAWVLRADGDGIRLGTRLSGAAAQEALEQALDTGMPVDGVVESRNPGGFVVRLGKVRAFCPVSHIDRIVAEDLDSYIGRSLSFKVLELGERDVVVSHRAIADAAAEAGADDRWAELAEGQLLDGVVTSVKDFGAFVDVDGVSGLVPRRELGWGNPPVAPTRGQRVSVRVLEIDHAQRRLTLSMRDPDSGPWSQVGTTFASGGSYPGRVVRLTDFGAFVELAPGLQGLVHISELSDQRVRHPSDVVEVGQQVTVQLLSVDAESQRLKLSLRQAGDHEVGERAPRAHADSGSLGTFADLLGGLKLD